MMERLEPLQAALAPYPWAWTLIAAAALVLAAWLANWVTKRVLLRGLQRLLRASPLRGDNERVKLTVIPRLANVIPALILSAGVAAVPGLPAWLVATVHNVCSAFIVLTVALAVSRALDLVNAAWQRRPDANSKPIKGYLQLLKIVMYVLAAVLVIALLFDRSPLILLTGMGAMSAVLLLVFKDTILSLVASVQLSNNDMLRVGDWIEMPSLDADGDVIDIALNTVKVQNWDKTITTIPTYRLISESFKNWRGMSESGGRRIKRSLLLDQKSVRFLDAGERQRLRRIALIDDYLDAQRAELEAHNARLEAAGKDPVNNRRATNLGTFRAYVAAYLRAHPGVNQHMTLMVRQLEPTPAGLPMQVYCFSADTGWVAYENLAGDIFDHLLAVLPEFGLRVFQGSSDAPLSVSITDRSVGDAAR
jgi:miniconductance mechanosensitive channel